MRTLHRYALPLAALLVFVSSLIATVLVFAPERAQAQGAGAAVITLDTPVVESNGTVSANGSVVSGLTLCSGTTCGVGWTGNLCNCCSFPPRECTNQPWRSCLVTGVSYSITGPIARSGAATITGTTRSPSTCTTQCSVTSDGGDPQCTDNSGFSVNTSGLTPGSYTMTVTSTDCRGQNSASRSFTVTSMHTLSVNKAGTGGGRVTSSPAGIDCQASCSTASASFTSGTNVTLTATPNTSNGSVFAGWSGACSGTSNTCVVPMTQARTVTATFNLPPTNSNEPAAVNVQSNRTTTFSLSGPTPRSDEPLTAGSPRSFNSTAGSYRITPAAQQGCTYSVRPSASSTVSSGGSILFDIRYTCAAPMCSASPSSVNVNETTRLTATGGNNIYSWNTGGGSPANPTVSPVDVTYGTAGTKTITVTSNGFSGQCSVVVQNTLRCAPASATSPFGSTVSFTAQNGTGPYTWTTTTGSPDRGSGQTFNTAFTQSGTQSVTVTSGGQSATCSVQVGTQPTTVMPTTSLFLRDPATGNYNLESITIPYNTPVGIRWSASNAGSCDGPTGPGGDLAGNALNPGRQTAGTVFPTNPLTQSFTYFTTCHNGANRVSDYATVNVQPECLPAGQTVAVGQAAALTARGGNGTSYTWAASGGTPSAGSGASFSASYTTTGTKNVTVTSGGQTSTCTVTVGAAPVATGTIQVVSNVPTTWRLTGPSGGNRTQSSLSGNVTYASMPVGNYVLGDVAQQPGFGVPTIAPASAQALTQGGTTVFSITYPTAAASVDLDANGSDNPSPIVSGTRALLTWATSGIATGTCAASSNPAGWSGAKPDANADGENSQLLSANTIFTLTCRKASDGTNISDSVTVAVRRSQCEDGADNDGDGRVDSADPGCGSDDDDDERNTWPECNDNIDNADPEDTLADESDPGCWRTEGNPSSFDPADNDEENAAPIVTHCNDGLDNDGDGRIDSADVGCASTNDESELGDPDIREI